MAVAMPPEAISGEVRQKRLWTGAAAVIAMAAFLYFAHYRVRYIGGCDSPAYLLESWRLRGLDVGLARDPAVPQQGALVPLCMVEHAGIVRSFFPPGFSLLLAGAGAVGLEFHVTPLSGALSGLLLFLVARPRVGPALALATMMAWLGAPLLLWGSTAVMSDVPATTLLLGAFFAADQRKTSTSGILVGCAMGVRPETVLFVPALIAFFPSRAEMWRLSVGLGAAGLGWLAFFLASFGSLHLPYTSNMTELYGENFGRQMIFLLAETARQHAPVMALAIVALVRSPRVCLPYLLWFAPFVVLHALWRVPYEAWWHARFVLPALPALFLLAAIGAASLRDALRNEAVRYALSTSVLAAYLTWCFTFEPASIHRFTEWDERYASESRRIAARLPHNSLVGAVNYSAPLRYYGKVETFLWCHIDAPALIRWALDVGRPVYAVVEGPVELCEGLYNVLLPTLDVTLVEELSADRRVFQLSRPPIVGERGQNRKTPSAPQPAEP
jgi:hypothetical protein